jgi:D-glycero-D-manno-heptose 1,7-bisphosphate phosphatase
MVERPSARRTGAPVGWVLLDRDDTIIVDRPYLDDPDRIEFLPGAVAGLRRMTELGLGIAVLTNQSGVGRGLISAATLAAIHERLCRLVAAGGGRIDAVFHCPHTPADGCACRKPAPGLLDRAQRELGFGFWDVFVAGDRWSDVEAGRRRGAVTLWVPPSWRVGRPDDPPVRPDHVVPNLLVAAEVIARRLAERATWWRDAPLGLAAEAQGSRHG